MKWFWITRFHISSLSLVFHSWFIFSCLSLCPELHISLLFHIQKTPGRDEIKGEREVNEGQDIRKQEPRDKDDEWDEGVKTSTRSICPMHRLFSTSRSYLIYLVYWFSVPSSRVIHELRFPDESVFQESWKVAH